MNIRFMMLPEPGYKDQDKLDCKILLSRVPLHSFSISADGTNSPELLGCREA